MKIRDFRLGGYSAIIVGILSILYALFYLGVSRAAPTIGMLGSWIILALSGIFTSAAFVALFLRLRQEDEGLAIWGLILGAAASYAIFQHGAYEALLYRAGPVASGQALPSQVDPAGLATFFSVGVASLVFGRIILRSSLLPRALGTVGMVNGAVLIILFFATAFGLQSLILVTGGLTSLILGPIWWIWSGVSLVRQAVGTQARHAVS